MQYLNRFFDTEITYILTSVISCVTNNIALLSPPLRQLFQKWQLQTQQLCEHSEQRTEAEMLVISIPFPTVTGRVRSDKRKQQQRQNTSEIINRFQSLSGIRYNQVPFESDELYQSHVAG